MSRYTAYPEYKDSGVEWLTKIPNHWKLTRVKESAKVINGYPFDSSKFDSAQGTPLVRIRDIHASKTEVGFVGDVPSDSLIFDGDILIGMDGDFNVAKWKGGKAALNQRVACVRATDVNLQKFIYYVLPFNMKVTNDLTYFTTVKHLSSTDILKTRFALPPKDEIGLIANFLDHEIAKIDTLIAKQQELIKLLKEKRQAVISHAVTKGLNPNAPMRDSGVEWFDKIPSHWVVSKFSYLSMVVRGGSPRPAGDLTLFNGNFSPWVTVAEITKDNEIYLNETETFLTQKGSEQCRVFSADTLILSNSGGTLGVPKILKINANANDGVLGFENLNLSREFACFYLTTLTEKLREQIRNKGGSTQINLNTDIVKDISVPVPPNEEIEEIVAHIFKAIEIFKMLEDKAEAGIQLLKERRTALISAAVTGKIDVREWRPPSDVAIAA
jgi:type I restriction enzyme S subunit